MESFVHHVIAEGRKHYRDFAWRNTRNPYAILLSEVMLQQTQVTRVVNYYTDWLQRFPTVDALASAETAEVLAVWQGLGYNRRALALKHLAVEVSENQGGVLPSTNEDLQLLPGIGPATAAGIMAFAHNTHSAVPYLETNVRSVVLHEIFADSDEVCDKEVMAVVKQAAEYVQTSQVTDARTWNYALLDYGAWLKKAFPNPSRRSKQHVKQSRFEGSFRQKRAMLLKEILAQPQRSAAELAVVCEYELAEAEAALSALTTEGFIQENNGLYFISE